MGAGTISYPGKSSITSQDRALVVSLGGSASSTTVDKISTLAKAIADAWNEGNSQKRVVAVTGHATPFTISSNVADRIVEIGQWMLEKSGHAPRLVLVGKSMGGCKLHRVVERFADEAIGVDLFVGVDMSCHVARHFENWVEHGWDEKRFPAGVAALVNFYQTRAGETQDGHVAIWSGHGACQSSAHGVCLDYNVDVHRELAYIDASGALVHGDGAPISPADPGHLAIDSDPGLLAAVEAVIRKRILEVL
jgi:hypothetical protein